MTIKYEIEQLKILWELTGEIGALSEQDSRYISIYTQLATALDEAEVNGLIIYGEE